MTKRKSQKSNPQMLLTFTCVESGHDFECIGDGYYKRDSHDVPQKDKVYRMILCPKCGETREICVRDSTIN